MNPANPGRLSSSRPPRRITLIALASAIVLAGCGQRGPLYLPGQPPPKKSLSSPHAPEPALASMARHPFLRS